MPLATRRTTRSVRQDHTCPRTPPCPRHVMMCAERHVQLDRRAASLMAVAFCCLVLGACARNTERSLAPQTATADRHLVTADQIERSGARTVWDAIRHTLPEFSLREGPEGRPARVARRGQSSIMLKDQALIVLDGVALADLARLSE